ncbi:MAG: ferredoxin-thioredoxin reductase catalytic domain-containing protein [Candidatus Aenigmatarchaeota archaeon]
MKVSELKKLFENFCKGKEFILNPEKGITDRLLKGILENEKRIGLKYCPCRLPSGNFEEDLELICPCNFFVHQTWIKEGRCWCGLFLKRV